MQFAINKQQWYEPNATHLSEILALVAKNGTDVQRRAAAGRETTMRFSRDAMATKMQARLKAIGSALSKEHRGICSETNRTRRSDLHNQMLADHTRRNGPAEERALELWRESEAT